MGVYRFSWVVEGEVAGMAMPDGLPEDWSGLKNRGVGALVNMTDHDWEPEQFRESGLAYLQLPVPDFAPPSTAQVEEFLSFCTEQIKPGEGIVVHCRAGMGRTGTMLACYLVNGGMDSDAAIRFVRRLRPGSIETLSQEGVVHALRERLLQRAGR